MPDIEDFALELAKYLYRVPGKVTQHRSGFQRSAYAS
jgi:hypothetical protein